MWNVFTRPMELRTNNALESYHRRWNETIGGQHPSIWQLIRVLKDQESIDAIRFLGNSRWISSSKAKVEMGSLENRIIVLKT